MTFRVDTVVRRAGALPRLQPGRSAAAPGLLDRAAGLAGAAARTAVRVAGGLPALAAPAERDRRLAICRRCDAWTGTICRVCGCVGRWKAALAGEACPHPTGPRW